jgi:hypothetical protein
MENCFGSEVYGLFETMTVTVMKQSETESINFQRIGPNLRLQNKSFGLWEGI